MSYEKEKLVLPLAKVQVEGGGQDHPAPTLKKKRCEEIKALREETLSRSLI